MNETQNDSFDILQALENWEEPKVHDFSTKLDIEENQVIETQQSDIHIIDDSHLFFDEEINTPKTIPENTIKKSSGGILKKIIFLFKYLTTSALIFVVLLFSTNFSAYSHIISSYVFQKDFEARSQSLLNSVQASSLVTVEQEAEDISLESATTLSEKSQEFNSIEVLSAKAKKSEIDLGITITPYENRVVIPKIGKNIPLVDIQQQQVNGLDELNSIFMEELEKWVVRYPGSAKPGQEGNTFVFGHSSNFPWIEGDFNDVFALLDKVVFDDEVIVYYDQKKYIYKIRTKEVIRPGDTSILKRSKGKSEITLMTCWPIGTTLNRLILIGELVDVQ